MATFVEGDSDVFAVMRYGAPTQSVIDYVEQEYNRSNAVISDVGRRLMDSTYQIFQENMNSDVFRIAKAAVRRVGSLWGTDVIRQLNQIWEIQNAPMSMVRYVMAQPDIRNLYHNQSCEGYGKDYADAQPNLVGEDHLDWCRVMNGVAVIDDDGWDATTYGWSTENADEAELDLSEQMDILNTWDNVKWAISEGVDPTSRYDHDL